MCQNLSELSEVWQSDCKAKTVQFFAQRERERESDSERERERERAQCLSHFVVQNPGHNRWCIHIRLTESPRWSRRWNVNLQEHSSKIDGFRRVSGGLITDKLRGIFVHRVAQNKIPHQTICNISTTSGLILKKILEAAYSWHFSESNAIQCIHCTLIMQPHYGTVIRFLCLYASCVGV